MRSRDGPFRAVHRIGIHELNRNALPCYRGLDLLEHLLQIGGRKYRLVPHFGASAGTPTNEVVIFFIPRVVHDRKVAKPVDLMINTTINSTPYFIQNHTTFITP